MKEQYVGDINDYRKYALLRSLSERSNIGICWMLTPNDGGTDGNKRAYLAQITRWRGYDKRLFDLLLKTQAPGNRLELIERSGIIPNAKYFSEIIPDHRISRASYMDRCAQSFSECQLIFFDPDNGLDVPSKSPGQRNSSKYLYREEVRRFYSLEKSLLIYQHFCREKRRLFVSRLSNDLMQAAPQSSITVFKTSHVAFFRVVHPAHKIALSGLADSDLYNVM